MIYSAVLVAVAGADGLESEKFENGNWSSSGATFKNPRLASIHTWAHMLLFFTLATITILVVGMRKSDSPPFSVWAAVRGPGLILDNWLHLVKATGLFWSQIYSWLWEDTEIKETKPVFLPTNNSPALNSLQAWTFMPTRQSCTLLMKTTQTASAHRTLWKPNLFSPLVLISTIFLGNRLKV